MHQTQATAATAETMKISSDDCARVNPAVLTEKLSSAEFSGIRLNRVDEVAAVATQAVMRPSPQTTCPVTSAPVHCDERMKAPLTSVSRANVYPISGKRYFAAAV